MGLKEGDVAVEVKQNGMDGMEDLMILLVGETCYFPKIIFGPRFQWICSGPIWSGSEDLSSHLSTEAKEFVSLVFRHEGHRYLDSGFWLGKHAPYAGRPCQERQHCAVSTRGVSLRVTVWGGPLSQWPQVAGWLGVEGQRELLPPVFAAPLPGSEKELKQKREYEGEKSGRLDGRIEEAGGPVAAMADERRGWPGESTCCLGLGLP